MSFNIKYRPFILLVIIFYFLQCKAINNQPFFIDSLEWKKSSKNLDFSESEKPKEKEKEKKNKKIEKLNYFNFGISKNVAIVGAIILVAGILILILYSFKGRNVGLSISKTKFNVNNLNEFSEEEEILKAIENALNNKNLSLAFRYNYLQIIQQLIKKNLINFKKYNTNFDLVYQIKISKTQDVFKSLTIVFDALYYGEKEIIEIEYKSFVNDFEQLKILIKNHES